MAPNGTNSTGTPHYDEIRLWGPLKLLEYLDQVMPKEFTGSARNAFIKAEITGLVFLKDPDWFDEFMPRGWARHLKLLSRELHAKDGTVALESPKKRGLTLAGLSRTGKY